MTNTLAVILFLLILAAVLAEIFVIRSGWGLAIAREGVGFIQSLALWR